MCDGERRQTPEISCQTKLHDTVSQGSAHSGRLKYAMACGAVVIWPRHEVKGREEFFHHLLMVRSAAFPDAPVAKF